MAAMASWAYYDIAKECPVSWMEQGPPFCSVRVPHLQQSESNLLKHLDVRGVEVANSAMDYLTVPAMASTSQMEKEDQGMAISPGTLGPAANQGSGVSAGGKPDPSTVMAVTSMITPSGGKSFRKLSKIPKIRRGSKIMHATQRPKLMVKPSRHRRHRYRRRMTIQEILNRSWQKSYPYLIELRKIIFELTHSFLFDFFICSVVAINTILLVAQTFAVVEIRGEWFFSALDPVFLCVYVVEFILKFIAIDFDYFRDPWNGIDFFIMFMTVLEFVLSLFITAGQGNRGNTITLFRVLKIFKGIRAIRAIRFLLTLRVTENLQEITGTFVLSCQSIGAIILLMFSFLFMSSVVLRDMFNEVDEKHFRDLFKTIFTLFQLFTLDDWSLIYLTCYRAGAWYIIIFLIIYILVEYFLLLNLVIAVLVDNFQMSLLKRQEKKKLKQKMIQLKESTAEDDASKQAEKAKLKEEEEENLFRKTVMEKYGSLELTDREWQLLYSYFQLMTAIENNQQHFQSQASTTNKILDTFFETSEEDFFPK